MPFDYRVLSAIVLSSLRLSRLSSAVPSNFPVEKSGVVGLPSRSSTAVCSSHRQSSNTVNMTQTSTESLPISLLDLLSNSLILYQLCPYLPLSSKLHLAATSKNYYNLVFKIPGVFRYLDLSLIKGAVSLSLNHPSGDISRGERKDEALTEDEFYSGPLRGIFYFFRKRGVLQDVQTLILDGLSVTAELVNEILHNKTFNVRILSIRGVKNMNERKLMQVLKFATRPSRPADSPKLKGLYYFGAIEKSAPSIRTQQTQDVENVTSGVTTSIGAQLGAQWNQKSQQALISSFTTEIDPWYGTPNLVIPMTSNHLSKDWSPFSWGEILQMCQGIIAFDAVLCRGPRHSINDSENGGAYIPKPKVATFTLGRTRCQICRSVPEGYIKYNEAHQHQLPLLSPPPLHSSSVRDAQRVSVNGISTMNIPFLARCDCITERYCEGCRKFWCENCYNNPGTGSYTYLQKQEIMDDIDDGSQRVGMGIKVHLGLCVEGCLVEEMYNGAGSGGMWG